MESIDVITFGEAMAMFIADSPGPLHANRQFTMELAGAETNVAIGLAKLGLNVGFVSKVGTDAFGRFIIQTLQNQHVNIEQLQMDSDYPTGFQLKSQVIDGDPEVQYFRKGSAASHLNPSDFKDEYFRQARHLHVTGIPLAISNSTRDFAKHAIAFMKKQKKTITFDTNLRPSLWNSKEEMIKVTNKFANQANIVLPGLEEGQLLTGYQDPKDISSFYLDAGVEMVIVKLGKNGAFYKTSDHEGFVSGYKVKQVVDTVGAGDGFAVGIISGVLENLPIENTIARGNAIGALAIQSLGDNTGYPDQAKLLDFLNNHYQGVN